MRKYASYRGCIRKHDCTSRIHVESEQKARIAISNLVTASTACFVGTKSSFVYANEPSFALTYSRAARISRQCRANCIYDNARLVRDGIKREATVIFVACERHTVYRPASRISCGLSCVLTSLTLTRGDTMGRHNCRISHNETRWRARAWHSPDAQRARNEME